MTLAALRSFRSYDDFYGDWLAHAAADGLPAVPPTPARLEAALAAMDLPADKVIGKPDRELEILAQDVALHCVMAGCRPEYAPAVLAAVRAYLGDFTARSRHFDACAQAVIVNGPIRAKLMMNCRDGLLGPGWRPNASIGRALRLLLCTIHGSARSGGFGDPAQYALCFGEDEEGTDWAPLHADAGLQPGQDAVTVHSTAAYKQMMYRSAPVNGRAIFEFIALFLRGRAAATDWFGAEPLSLLLVIGHELRRYLEAEWPDKRVFREQLLERVADPALPGHAVNLASVEDLAVVSAGGVAFPTVWALVSPGVRPATRAITTGA